MSGGKHDPHQNRTVTVKTGGGRRRGKRARYQLYKASGRRERNKRRRIEKDARRTKLEPCGHASRYSRSGGSCSRCK